MNFKNKLVTLAQTLGKMDNFDQKLPKETAVLHNVIELETAVYLELRFLGG